jgi:exosome complex protein LRP1
MDPQTDLPDLVEDLEVNIDELTSTLSPLLTPSLSTTSATLPLLEKAKLHVLAAYSIESLLFSALLASGTDAKSHPLFAELGRLKKYFAKIKDAEEFTATAGAPRARLDVGAAQRFIKHGLSGNERYDEMRKERMAKEKERALEKARALTNKKFGGEEEESTPKKRSVEAEEEEDEEDEETKIATPAKKLKISETETTGKKQRGKPSK